MVDKDWMADIERRVSALEQGSTARARARARDASEGAGGDPDVFWALEGLRSRTSDPGAVLITGAVMLPDGRRAQWQEAGELSTLLTEDWADAADVLAALGHPVRLRLLHRVLSGVGTVQELMQTEGVGTSGQVYHHLRQLLAAGWLRSSGGGRYEVPVGRAVPLLTTVLGARR